ncbi:ATP-dependent DNA ligase [Metschnikowia bicuspidata var. bicuspidata NRRL YB-4993]|uniref:DNA ligase n=1 Tax=Metschnikowia bicuspidata var. bicuspidata NRRL YB-4993 TaxID=869754 RepID=A0A1A0HF05_9ASCO|nr:ATP-dependent DNA ligase [Metschnikowia bicuspidata var. bicuspidata NRRL YB-4993]OBA22709.1 ATP-dependent DNA ligase [Metschnikowia bicuspidata var. bicuspidata NRRL YB-4993]
MGQQSILRFFSDLSKSPAKTTKRKSSREPSPASKARKTKIEDSPNVAANSSENPEVSTEPVLDPADSPGPKSVKEEAEKLIELSEENHKHPILAPSTTKIPYAKLTAVLDRIEAEPGRLKMTAIVVEFFTEILEQFQSPDELVRVVYLFINRLGPDYEPDLELGLGETILIKAIGECYGRAPAKIKKDYQEVGDLGLVAQQSRSGQPPMFKPTALDVDTVFENLTKIAKSTGKDSQSRKISIINKMLTSCDMKSSEAKFLIRSLEGKLRIGLAEKTVLVSLAQAFLNHENKSAKRINSDSLSKAEDVIREAFSLIPNYEVIIRNAFQYGILNLLDHCQLTPGVPLKPMLAKPTKSIGEVLDRFQGEEFTCEYKYDGERAQVHLLDSGEVRIYSRNSEDMSQRYPDLVSIVKDFIKTSDETNTGTPRSMLLDCEAVAWDRESKKILPFQVLSTRKRKDVDEKDIKVHICLFVFDVLCFNGDSLITKSLLERRQCLFDNFTPIEGKFQFATFKNSSDLNELQLFLDQSVKDSCEGLMVKMLHGAESFYEPSKRSRNWLKLKKDYLAGVGDSLDLVVVGAYIGKGKRTGSYGGFLLAAYNDDTGEYETTCKIGTGFSDEDLATLYAKLKPTEISAPKPFYVYDTTNSNAVPDVWLEPTSVFEVLTADLSLSPIYKAAYLEYGKGISLRFPRFLRLRDDKGVEDATTSSQVSEFYQRQTNVS